MRRKRRCVLRGPDRDRLLREAIRRFGTTDEPTEACFIAPDGRWLRCGPATGHQDYAVLPGLGVGGEPQATSTWELDSRVTRAMRKFMRRTKSIRTFTDYCGQKVQFDLECPPTPDQDRVMRAMLRGRELAYVDTPIFSTFDHASEVFDLHKRRPRDVMEFVRLRSLLMPECDD